MLEGFRQNALDFVQPNRHNWIGSTNSDADVDSIDEQFEQSRSEADHYGSEPPAFNAARMREARKSGALVGGAMAIFAGVIIVTVANVDRALERFAVIGFMGMGGAFIGSDLIARHIYEEDD